MTLKELSQLYWLNREIELDQKRLEVLDMEIQKDEERLSFLESTLSVPSCSNYDDMPKNIGFENKLENDVVRIIDQRESVKQKKNARSNIAATIREKQTRCLTERNRLERYISGISDSLLRLIFTFRFINGLTWAQVSEHIGMHTTEDSVKKLCYRYLKYEKESITRL